MISITKKTVIYIITALFLFFLARLSLLILYNSQFASLSWNEKIFAFVEGMRFDLSSIVVFFSIPILLMNFPLKIFKNKYYQGILSWLLFGILIVGIGFLMGDVVYFDFVKRHIAYELFLMGGDDAGVIGEMLFGVFLPHLILFCIIVGVLFLVWKRITNIPLKPIRFGLVPFLHYFVMFLLLVIAARGGLGYKPVTIIDAFASGNTEYSNLVLNGVFSMSHSSLRGKNVNHHFFDELEALEHLNHTPENKTYPFQKKASGSQHKQYNLVFVLIESLSFKYVDSFGKAGYGVTPNLDRLAKLGLQFENFFAVGQRSVEGIQATLTGIPSIIGLPTIGIGLPANYSKLGQIAKDNGYSTIFVQSLKRRSFRVDAIAGSTGFQEYYGMEDMPILLDYPDPKEAKYGWDYETYMFSAEKMEKATKPFLTYIITSTTHTPYPRLPEGLEKYPHSTNDEKGFLNTINYTDWSIGKFIKRLEKQPWFENTIFIFTADHALAHYQGGTFMERFRIPLIIYAPKILKPQKNPYVCSQLDVFTTIIELLNLNSKFSSFGRSLFDLDDQSFALVREGSVMGIITEKGFLRHSLQNRLEIAPFQKNIPSVYFDSMEKKLLAADQLTFELLKSNRWAE